MDRMKTGTKQWLARQRRHRHNSFFGHARMMQMQCQSIISADSTSSAAKTLARQIQLSAEALSEALKKRID